MCVCLTPRENLFSVRISLVGDRSLGLEEGKGRDVRWAWGQCVCAPASGLCVRALIERYCSWMKRKRGRGREMQDRQKLELEIYDTMMLAHRGRGRTRSGFYAEVFSLNPFSSARRPSSISLPRLLLSLFCVCTLPSHTPNICCMCTTIKVYLA